MRVFFFRIISWFCQLVSQLLEVNFFHNQLIMAFFWPSRSNIFWMLLFAYGGNRFIHLRWSRQKYVISVERKFLKHFIKISAGRETSGVKHQMLALRYIYTYVWKIYLVSTLSFQPKIKVLGLNTAPVNNVKVVFSSRLTFIFLVSPRENITSERVLWCLIYFPLVGRGWSK